MELKTGYKKSEVGIIPENWEVKELGEICWPSKKRINPVISNVTYKCVELEHLSQGSGILLGYENSKKLLSHKSVFEKGDVLFGKLRPYLRKFLYADFNGVCTTEIWVLKAGKDTSNLFLYYLVQSEKIIEAANLSTGTKMPRAEWSTVAETKIAYPTKAEQTAIATALSDADGLIRSLEKLIAKKRLIKQGAMQELLKPKEGWVVKKLGEVGECIRGVSYNAEKDLFAHDNEYTLRLFRSNNIQESKVVYSDVQYVHNSRVSKKQYMQDDDILICMANGNKALVGKAAIFKRDDSFNYTFGAFMGCLRVFSNGINKSFIFYNFLSYNFRSYIDILLSGSSINNLKPSDVESIKIPLPCIEEQNHIAKILLEMDIELMALESKLEKYKQIKQGMMQNLLTGKIRLV